MSHQHKLRSYYDDDTIGLRSRVFTNTNDVGNGSASCAREAVVASMATWLLCREQYCFLFSDVVLICTIATTNLVNLGFESRT
mmetsp:Transcript_45213/g.72716  ORF Transcript_45213/g.72716 Transcript_45213/m.72716 type:complete len:83 (-) Transcript_45213:434-682(-)